jgi:hypothetical protein
VPLIIIIYGINYQLLLTDDDDNGDGVKDCLQDQDKDGIPDFLDADDDGDGVPDILDPDCQKDSDSDGIPDYRFVAISTS